MILELFILFYCTYGLLVHHCLHSCGFARVLHSTKGQEQFSKYNITIVQTLISNKDMFHLKALGTCRASTSSSIFDLVTPTTT